MSRYRSHAYPVARDPRMAAPPRQYGGRRGLKPRSEPILDAGKGGFGILRINFAARRYGTRQKFRFPPVHREDVEDFHAGLRADERQPLRRRAVGVELAIRVASVGGSDNRSVVGSGSVRPPPAWPR